MLSKHGVKGEVRERAVKGKISIVSCMCYEREECVYGGKKRPKE